jgi:hypothetical protein
MPFAADTDEALYQAVRTQHPVAPSERNPLVPVQFEKVLLRCLEKNPGRRYGSSEQLKADLSSRAPRERIGIFKIPLSRRTAVIVGICLALLIGIYYLPGNGAGGDTQTVTIEAVDGPADVFRNGDRVGKTPFRMSARPGDSVQLELRRPGFLDQSVQFDVSERKVYSYSLQPARR